MATKNWIKRELIGTMQLDKLPSGHQMSLKAFRKWWKDGTTCLDIITYIEVDGKVVPFWPIKHIQITWDLAAPFISIFEKLGTTEEE